MGRVDLDSQLSGNLERSNVPPIVDVVQVLLLRQSIIEASGPYIRYPFGLHGGREVVLFLVECDAQQITGGLAQNSLG